MNYKKEIPNVKWGNPHAAKDAYVMSYIDQDIQQWPTLPADKMVPGFAAGMDDLAQIVLNNKFKTKFNRNALTLPGAEDWVAKKNRTIKDPSKYWVAGLGDLNKDGVKEVLIKDGNGNVRYINGWHLGKTTHNMDKAFQEYVEQYGMPTARMQKKAQGQIPGKALSHMYFMRSNLKQDPDNPDGPMIPSDTLVKAGYKSRAPSAANLFLTYVVKECYDDALNQVTQDVQTQKMIKKICSVIQANAIVYKIYVTSEAIGYFNNNNITEKEAKKKKSGQQVSPFSYYCLRRVEQIAGDANTRENITIYIRDRLLGPVSTSYKYQPAGAIYSENPEDIQKGAWDGKHIRPRKTTNVPNINAYINNAGGEPISGNNFLNATPHYYNRNNFGNNQAKPITEQERQTIQNLTKKQFVNYLNNDNFVQKFVPNYVTFDQASQTFAATGEGGPIRIFLDDVRDAIVNSWDYNTLKAHVMERETNGQQPPQLTNGLVQQVEQQLNQIPEEQLQNPVLVRNNNAVRRRVIQPKS